MCEYCEKKAKIVILNGGKNSSYRKEEEYIEQVFELIGKYTSEAYLYINEFNPEIRAMKTVKQFTKGENGCNSTLLITNYQSDEKLEEFLNVNKLNNIPIFKLNIGGNTKELVEFLKE